MQKAAQDYPVTTPYGATGSPYSPAKPHRGHDRSCPRRTPIIIAGVLMGYTGNTGWVFPKPTPKDPDAGSHLHTQAGSDIGCQKTFEPSRLEFKPGKVVKIRTYDPGTEGSWGKFFTLQVGNEYITYAHLDEVLVTVGQEIKAPEPPKTTPQPSTHPLAWTVGKDVYLPPTDSTWRVYALGSVAPRKQVATLNPVKYGGLWYRVLGTEKASNSVRVRTQMFGEVSLPIASDGNGTLYPGVKVQ